MKIYIGHSKDINYIEELYKPIREFEGTTNHNFILPHEASTSSNNNRASYSGLDLFIAEVSMPATGLGIELGWAYDSNVPIVCISKKGKKISGSLRAVTDKFLEYKTIEELKNLLDLIIKENEQLNLKKYK